jgi:hypothetical protein
MRKEGIMAQFNVVSWCIVGEPDENHDERQGSLCPYRDTIVEQPNVKQTTRIACSFCHVNNGCEAPHCFFAGG